MLRTHDLSDQAIATAVRGLILESKRCSERMNIEGLDEDEAEHLSECAYTLFRTLGEFEELYRARQMANTTLMPFDELYATLSGFDWLLGPGSMADASVPTTSEKKSLEASRPRVAMRAATLESAASLVEAPRVVPLATRRSSRDG